MATITLTIPDAQLTRISTALCKAAGMPVSTANAKEAIINHVKATVQNVERSEAIVAARAQAEADAAAIAAPTVA